MLPLEHSAILLTFIKLPFVIKIFVVSIFEWPFYAAFTVQERTTIDMNGRKRVNQDQILFNRKKSYIFFITIF